MARELEGVVRCRDQDRGGPSLPRGNGLLGDGSELKRPKRQRRAGDFDRRAHAKRREGHRAVRRSHRDLTRHRHGRRHVDRESSAANAPAAGWRTPRDSRRATALRRPRHGEWRSRRARASAPRSTTARDPSRGRRVGAGPPFASAMAPSMRSALAPSCIGVDGDAELATSDAVAWTPRTITAGLGRGRPTVERARAKRHPNLRPDPLARRLELEADAILGPRQEHVRHAKSAQAHAGREVSFDARY